MTVSLAQVKLKAMNSPSTIIPTPLPLLAAKSLCTHFPVKKGFFRKTVSFLPAVSAVDLKIFPAEIVGIVGESGCGKSTLAHTLVGLQNKTSGSIIWQNDNKPAPLILNQPADWKPIRQQLQMIFQDPHSSLNPQHSVYEILQQALQLKYGRISAEQISDKINTLLQKVGLAASMQERFPHELSGGQKQRINIARALAIEPRLIICDEILSSLDVSVQAQIVKLLLDLKNEYNLSLLFISHDLAMVRLFCSRIYVMYCGKIVEMADSKTLFEAPRHPYTKALISAIPTLNRDRPPQILPGEVASLSKLPSGCAFRLRCSNQIDICAQKTPQFEEEQGQEQSLEQRPVRGFACFNVVAQPLKMG